MLKWLKISLFGLPALGLMLWGGVTFWSIGDNTGYAPEQPIPFNHKLHAGDLKVPCMYCHAGVNKSRSATIPSMNICMNCHSVVATDRPNVQKLRDLYEKGEVFEWVKVHDLPDFVFFNHQRHISRGVKCEKCHGPVEKMTRVKQVESLKMGWCVECHRSEVDEKGEKYNAPIGCEACHN